MMLPGRLRTTTLGDVLGTLHRARANGTLELLEDRGRTHRVHFAHGLVVAVELDGAQPSLGELLRRERAVDDDVLRRSLLRALASRRLHGEVLVQDFHLSPHVVGAALRRQVLARLKQLEILPDARVRFCVTLPAPRGALRDRPLEAPEFLAGRRRARDRQAARGDSPRSTSAPPPRSAAESGPAHVLGVPPGADATEIKRAYRALARRFHPDLHPNATDEERRELATRFAEVTAAYRALVA